MQTASEMRANPSEHPLRRRSVLMRRVSGILSRRFSQRFAKPFVEKRPVGRGSTSPNEHDTSNTVKQQCDSQETVCKNEILSNFSSSPVTVSMASMSTPGADRQSSKPQRRSHRTESEASERRMSSRFSSLSLSRLDLALKNRRESLHRKQPSGCECDAAHERDLLYARIGEMSMAEMENESLRARVGDLRRAVDSVKQQADDEIDCLVQELNMMRTSCQVDQDDFVECFPNGSEQRTFGTS